MSNKQFLSSKRNLSSAYKLMQLLPARLRNSLFKHRLKNLGAHSEIEANVRLQYAGNISLGSRVRVAHGTLLRANTKEDLGLILGDGVSILENGFISANGGFIRIGSRSWLGPACMVFGNGGVCIGNDVMIAAKTTINTVSHNYDRCDLPMNEQGLNTAAVIIGDDVWIGINVTILQGLSIGQGSIIGAGSLVNCNIPPWSIAVGCPARVIRKRTNLELCESI